MTGLGAIQRETEVNGQSKKLLEASNSLEQLSQMMAERGSQGYCSSN